MEKDKRRISPSFGTRSIHYAAVPQEGNLFASLFPNGFVKGVNGYIMATFEEQITKLEETVRLLERGDISLDESLNLFEQGIKLTKGCRELLDKAENKVKILVNGEKEDFDVNEEQA